MAGLLLNSVTVTNSRHAIVRILHRITCMFVCLNISICIADNFLSGIDVSHHQGEINWKAVKSEGVVFAFSKATEGSTYTDPQFMVNWDKMKEAGIVRGAFIFYHDNDLVQTQLEKFIAVVKLETGDLAPVVDVETENDDFPTKQRRTADLHDFLIRLEAHYKIKPIIYTSAKFWNKFYDDTFAEYPLWVAEYDVDSPTLPEGWKTWTLWQHSQSGHINGISVTVDLDFFNGTIEDLNQLVLQ